MPKLLHFPHKMIHFPQQFILYPFHVWLIKIEASAAPVRKPHHCIDVNISGCWCGFQHWPLLRRVSQPHCPCLTVTLTPPRQFSLAPTGEHTPQPTSHPPALTLRCFPYLNNVSISTETAMFAFLFPSLSSSLSGWFSLFSLKIECRRRLLLWWYIHWRCPGHF